jgi:predicted RND superfamily exporter protein
LSEPIDRRLSQLAAALVAASQRRPRAVVAVGLVVTAASLWLAATGLAVDSDPDRMTSPDLPFRQTKRALESAFPTLRDDLVIVVEADAGADARAAAREMGARLEALPERFPHVLVPGQGPFFERNRWLYLPLDDLRAAVAALAEGRAPAAPEPERRQLVLAQPARDFVGLEPALESIAAAREIGRELTPRPGLRVRVTGDLAVLSEEMSEIRTQVFFASVASFVLVTAVLLYTLRSFRLFLATVLLLAVGLAWTAGFAALAVGRLNVLTTAFAVLYIGLGVDFGIHFAMAYRERRALGDAPGAALHHAGGHVGSSLGFCALTTAMGFFAFVPTDYAAVAELGVISGTGMFLSLLATLTWYPATITLGLGDSPKLERPPSFEISLPSWPLRHPGPVVAVALVVAIGAGALARDVRFDENPLNVRDPRVESVQAMEDLLAESELSPWTIEVLTADRAEANRVAERLRALPEVAETRTVDDLLPDDQAAKLALLARIPDAAVPGLPSEPVGVDDLPEELRRRYLAADGRARVEVFASEDLTRPGALDRFADAVAAVRPDAAGAAVGTVEFARAIVDALRQALGTATLAILALLLLLWRSPRDAAITLTPLLLGSLCIAAVTVLADLPFNFANVIVLPLLLGIGVDSGIHLVHRHRLHLGQDRDILHTSTARAVLFSATTTLVSFMTLSFASHGGMASLALLLSLGIALMLAANLIVLPALLAKFGR